MITCDTFELDVSLDAHGTLRWLYWTDLPAGTRVLLEISRTYMDHSGSACLWTLHDEALTPKPGARGDYNGGSGELSVAGGDLAALQDFEEGLGQFSAGMATPPGDSIRVSLVVGARQPLKAFGRNNAHLTGGMVGTSGGINFVEVATVVSCPLSPEASPFDSEP